MRLEMTRTFPVPRQQGWDYIEDFRTWPDWMDVELVDPDDCARSKRGDTVTVIGKMFGLRFPGHGKLVLEKMVVSEMSRTRWEWPGWPDVHIEQHYSHAGPGAFSLRVVAYVDDDVSLLGKSAGWMMTHLPFMMRRQLHVTFDRLDEAFRSGAAKKTKAA